MDLAISRLQLRAGRALAGLSIADVARMVGVTAPTVCKLERDPPEGRVATLAAVIAAIESRGVRFVPGGAVLERDGLPAKPANVAFERVSAEQDLAAR